MVLVAKMQKNVGFITEISNTKNNTFLYKSYKFIFRCLNEK
jgi:hypothetical protein